MTANIGQLAGIALGFAMAIATPALAQQGQGQGHVAQQCAQDIAKFCEGIAHGGRKVRACLETNKANVSAECQTALATHGPGSGMGRGTGGQQK